VTDSAAGATSYSCGLKTNNTCAALLFHACVCVCVLCSPHSLARSFVAVDPRGRACGTILEAAQKKVHPRSWSTELLPSYKRVLPLKSLGLRQTTGNADGSSRDESHHGCHSRLLLIAFCDSVRRDDPNSRVSFPLIVGLWSVVMCVSAMRRSSSPHSR
jgi:hypothetical protein